MDETTSSRVSDAAATRKRRSSILKSQRAPRTPFSELEFNVTTPTDAGKSRRVSFSRRMGVAEFVKNEATTTWKNFYEEHNKSLESSGNDSGANAARPSISHIGKRIFDQQFEVEAVDFGSAMLPANNIAADFNMSINNINLTQQLAAFDCIVDDKKLVPPQQHLELSALTDHKSKIFSDDLTIPVIGEISNQISVNFSIMNPIGNSNDKCDDLDEIQKDLERSHHVVCPGPFREEHMSEYIEVDLNMTHVAIKNDASDMSITDTVHSPKVQEVSSNISVNKSRKPADDIDWTADKENIAVLNPYITPEESDNFAINEIPNQVLVFDGKKLTVQTEHHEIPLAVSEFREDGGNYRQTFLPDAPIGKTPLRKTVVLKINDDLPNFIENPKVPNHLDHISVSTQELKQTMIFDEGDLSLTQAIPNTVAPSVAVESSRKQKLIECDNMTANISMTRAVSNNIILESNASNEKRKTIIYNDDYGNISVTQAISTNILLGDNTKLPNKRRTTVYDNQDISFTQALPAKVIMTENNKNPSNITILYQNNIDDISLTQAVPNNLYLETSQNDKTKFYERSIGNISMTQILPSNLILSSKEPVSSKRKTIIYDNDDGNISMTQALPTNLFIPAKSQENNEIADKRKTIMFENDTGNVSLTEVLPNNIIQQKVSKTSDLDINNEKNVSVRDASINVSNNLSSCNPRKRLTIMYDDNADISVTQALPANILFSNQKESLVVASENLNISTEQTLPNNVLLNEKCEEKLTLQYSLQEQKDISLIQLASTSSNLTLKNFIVDDKNDSNYKLIPDLKNNILANNKQAIHLNATPENSETGNLSMNKPIPNKIFAIENQILKADVERMSILPQCGEDTLLQDNIHERTNDGVFIYQATTNNTLELQVNKTGHDYFQDEESKSSINTCKMTATSVESVKTLPTSGTHSDNVDEQDFEMQVCLQNDELPNEPNVVVGNFEVMTTSNPEQETKGNKSILHELLDMSITSVEDEVADKNIMAKVDTDQNLQISPENNPDETFSVKKYVNEKSVSNDSINKESCMVKLPNVDTDTLEEIENIPLPTIEYNADQENKVDDKLFELRRNIVDEEKKNRPHNRHYEKIVSSDLLESFKQDDNSKAQDIKMRKSFKEADNTKELLEILSDFTDGKSSTPSQEEKELPKIMNRKSLALEHKIDIPDPRHLSFAPKRQSIVISREDLLNNLSMAQAVLQQAHYDDSEMEDTGAELSTEINESIRSPKKSVRVSNDVVKTLHFEDESCCDVNLESDIKMSPLKKTAFGETSYMNEPKVNVIPTYLKDVSDNIKALMNDLVKPRPDQMPFEVATPRARKQTSTCSTEIQANLITSSQIDLDVELRSNVNSVYELNKTESLVADITDTGNKAITRALKGGTVNVVTDDSEMDVCTESNAKNSHIRKSSLKKPSQEPVLIFDHHNPLNNILLAPPDCTDVHKYNPVQSSEALNSEVNLNSSNKANESKKGNQCEVERVITQYNVASHVGLQSGDASSDIKGDSHILFSDPSKPLSMDRSTEGFPMELKNTEANTLIVMKENKELLEASSSLTLVDDALIQNVFDVKMETRKIDQNSPVKVIYKIDDEDVSMLENVESDLVSNDDEPEEYPKTRKRNYSPSRREVTRQTTLSSPDVTPKPRCKMQKVSKSPNVYNKVADIRHVSIVRSDKSDVASSDKTDFTTSDKTESHKTPSPRKSKGSPKYMKSGTEVKVQQLITEYKITKMEQDMIEDQIIEAIQERMSASGTGLDIQKVDPRSPDALSSCTSSKHQNEMQEECVKETASYVGSQPSRVDWQPEFKEQSSRNMLTECDSGVNVVAKIDMLPFMGRSGECEWETCGGDTWVFRLLRARLRLRVRLAHRHHNALRTRVRADTPVEEMAVDAVPVAEKDPLASLCVRFACEAMRYECARGCARAAAVPAALRRCAAVARVALRWARAMRDARARLAYTLTPDGLLTLKVANIALRSVWEVSMRLELVVEDAREAAWPRAASVRVRAVLGDRPPPDAARPAAALAHDWGHAPRTIWKIFRYLKNKTRSDDFLAVAGQQLQEAC